MLKIKEKSSKSQIKVKSFSILIYVFAFLIFNFNLVFALSINIDPSNIKLAIKSGETKTGEIIVQNSGSAPIRIKAYMEDWVYADDGSKDFIRSGSSTYSCSNWITLDTTSFSLGAKEDKKVKFTITAPNKSSGGHVSVIFFESQTQTKEGISVSGRIGTIVYLDTEGDINRNGELKELSVIGSNEGDEIKVNVPMINKGNTYLLAKLKLIITKDDKTVIEMPLRPIGALPGSTAIAQATLNKPLLEGKYKAQAEVTYEDKTLKSQAEFSIKKTSK
jgi:hypothetical protein